MSQAENTMLQSHVIGKKIHLGNSNFAEIIRKNGLYADKSLLIKEIIEDPSKSILITRPRRWGKTLNMSMLHNFFAAEVNYEKTEGLFDKLLISTVDGGKYMQHQGKYPVIYLTFKDVKCDSFDSCIAHLSNLINALYREHYYLKSSTSVLDVDKITFDKYASSQVDATDIENSLNFLSKSLYQHHGKKVYILIDEYDTPLNFAYGNPHFNDLVNLLKNLLSSGLKDNLALEKGIMTGIMRISKDSMLSGLNNLKVYTVLKAQYSEYFGFTAAELDLLFKNQGLELNEEAVQAWYNGYLIGGVTIYNPWSILSCLGEKGSIEAYWVNTASETLIKEALYNANSDIKDKLQTLMLGESIEEVVTDSVRFDELTSNTEAIWGVLLYTGYLTVSGYRPTANGANYRCTLLIPNKEIRGLYNGSFIEWLGDGTLRNERLIGDIAKHLVCGELEQFAAKITQLLLKVASHRDYATQPEAFYHGFMLALTAVLLDDYYIYSNRESGLGYPDMMFIPKEKNRAVILEFKHVKKSENAKQVAKSALEQIDVKHYASSIKQHSYIKEILKVGLAFDGKHVEYAPAVEATT